MPDELNIPSSTYRVPRRRNGMDPGTRKLAIIAGGLGGALVLLVGGWSLLGHRSTAVPVIQADSSPLRVKPANPGGMSVTGTSDEVLSDDSASAVGKLAPGSEAPAPQNIKAPTVAAAPPPATPALPPLAAAPVVAPPLMAAVKPPAPPAAAPVPSGHVAAADHAPRATGGKSTLVQLAAVSSEDAARLEWQRLEKRMPDLFASRHPAVSKIEHDGKTLYRLRTGGFSDIAQATTFCEQVRAKGNGCSIAAF